VPPVPERISGLDLRTAVKRRHYHNSDWYTGSSTTTSSWILDSQDLIREKAESSTRQWIQDWNLPVRDVLFCRGQKKHDVLDYDVLIDDRDTHIHDAVESDRHIVVFDRPWNQHVDVRLPRVRGWAEVPALIRMLRWAGLN
jgi:hypothetical protein